MPALPHLYQSRPNPSGQMASSAVQGCDIPPPIPGSLVCVHPRRSPTRVPDPRPRPTSLQLSLLFASWTPLTPYVPPPRAPPLPRVLTPQPQISRALSPPDLYYPPDPDRPTLSRETVYERTEPPEDVKPHELNGETGPSLVTIDQFIPEKDGHRVCIMCRYVLSPSSHGFRGQC